MVKWSAQWTMADDVMSPVTLLLCCISVCMASEVFSENLNLSIPWRSFSASSRQMVECATIIDSTTSIRIRNNGVIVWSIALSFLSYRQEFIVELPPFLKDIRFFKMSPIEEKSPGCLNNLKTVSLKHFVDVEVVYHPLDIQNVILKRIVIFSWDLVNRFILPTTNMLNGDSKSV